MTENNAVEDNSNKIRYEMRKMYYAFCDYQKYPAVQVDTYMWIRFRKDLNSTDLIQADWNIIP